ncbi:MAG: cyclic nucleotide-binding domain-containing protein, partial [Verrucomicrobiota bacterium]
FNPDRMKEYRPDIRPGEIPASVSDIPFFKVLGNETLNHILDHTTILDCEPGDHIVEEGSSDQSLLFLLKGKVRVTKEGTSISASWGSGELLGEVAMLRDGKRSATLVAETQVYCLRVDPSFLEDLSDVERSAYYASLYCFLAKLLAERLDSTTTKLAIAEQRLSELQQGNIG